MPLWDEAYLDTLIESADDLVTSAVDCIFDRFSIAITSGKSVYTLPSYVTKLVRITWKGKKLEPLTFQQFCILNPASAVVDESTKIESPSSLPKFYVRHPSNYRDIRFWPTPSEDIAEGTSNLFGSAIASYVIISCYRTQGQTLAYQHLPAFLTRRIKKAYVLSRAFAKEGKGQNLIASAYYKKKLETLLAILKDINSNVYIGKQRVLADAFFNDRLATPGRPVLPSDYE